MPRTILVHLNVDLPAADRRTADEIADAIVQTLTESLTLRMARVDDIGGLGLATVACPLAEEVYV